MGMTLVSACSFRLRIVIVAASELLCMWDVRVVRRPNEFILSENKRRKEKRRKITKEQKERKKRKKTSNFQSSRMRTYQVRTYA